MAKKPDSTSKPAAPLKRAVKPAAKTKTTGKATKAPVGKAKRAVKPPAPVEPPYTRHDVALRAYFIAEKRCAHGLAGNEHQDWLEAERQLAAEYAKPKRTKKA
jgi:hypothetical protein